MHIQLRTAIIAKKKSNAPKRETIIQNVKYAEVFMWTKIIEFSLNDSEEIEEIEYNDETQMYSYKGVTYDFCEIHHN